MCHSLFCYPSVAVAGVKQMREAAAEERQAVRSAALRFCLAGVQAPAAASAGVRLSLCDSQKINPSARNLDAFRLVSAECPDFRPFPLNEPFKSLF